MYTFFLIAPHKINIQFHRLNHNVGTFTAYTQHTYCVDFNYIHTSRHNTDSKLFRHVHQHNFYFDRNRIEKMREIERDEEERKTRTDKHIPNAQINGNVGRITEQN